MKPVRPFNPPLLGGTFVEIAANQSEYQPLPAYVDTDGLTMTEWELTDDDRAKIAAGGRIRLWVHTFCHPLQPLQMEVAVKP